uniref:Uncharacterized protein n=1 Tax=viral metagenome TaxID=1070528 RepID=A0A6C0LHP3_9ZZZZ
MIPRTSHKTVEKASFFENRGMRRLEDSEEEDFDFDTSSEFTNTREELDELYEHQRTELQKARPKSENSDIEVHVSNFYEYSGLQSLIDEKPCNIAEGAKIHVCPFQVNTKGKVPFLQFLMHKCEDDDMIAFASFSNQHDNVFLKACDSIDLMMMCYEKKGFMKYCGYVEKKMGKEYYLFFDITENEIDMHDLNSKNDLWLLTMDELINTKSVCGNFYVDPKVTQFFEEHPEFIFLQDANMDPYEIPVIAYMGTTSNKENFISVFGESRSNNKSMFGSHYYFYDYQYAVKKSMTKYVEEKKQELRDEKIKTWEYFMYWKKENAALKGSIIRFALFLGNMKKIENRSDDPADTSLITQELLKQDTTCATLEHRTLVNYLRISDRDSMWAQDYDSVFLGYGVELDDDTLHCHGTTYVVKEYEQQIPLTCHSLDSNTMNSLWEQNGIYPIL